MSDKNMDEKKDKTMEIPKNIINEELQDIISDSEDDLQSEEQESIKKTYRKLKHLKKITKQMMVSNSKAEMYEQIAKQFDELSGYEDASVYAEKCLNLAKKAKKEVIIKIYEEALNIKNNAKKAEDYHVACLEFRKISGYQDADEMAEQCEKMYLKLNKKATYKRLSIFALIVVLFICALIGADTAHAKYYTANAFMMTNSYNNAIKIYKKLGNYKDAKERLVKCQYESGTEYKKGGDYAKALTAFHSAGDYKDSAEQAVSMEKEIIKSGKAGEIVNIGGDKWEVLEISNNQAFLMLKSSMPGMPYHSNPADVTWETSSLRQWLNTEYFNKSFSAAEKENIILGNVVNDDNSIYGTDGGEDTTDYIYMMSTGEAEKYVSLFPDFQSNSWLRSPGNKPDSAAFLSVNKTIMYYGYAVDCDKINVRPVMRFKLD